MSAKELYRPLSPSMTSISKVEDVEPESAVRTYCYMSKRAWTLQVRGLLSLKSRRLSKDFVVASAVLGLDDIRALRDQLNEYIAEAEAPESEDA